MNSFLATIGSFLILPNLSLGAVLFDFVDSGAGDPTDDLDPGSNGSTMTATDGTDTVIFTIVDVLAPEYETVEGVTSATGNTLSALAGDSVVTNINGNADALGINNPSVTNSGYDSLGTGDGSEGNDINTGESVLFSFDQAVTLDQIELESNTEDPTTLSIDIGGTPIVFDLSTVGDFLNDPLAGVVIPANTTVTFLAGGDFETDFRIESLTVSVVPEPSTGALLGLVGLLAGLRRRR